MRIDDGNGAKDAEALNAEVPVVTCPADAEQ